MSVQNTFLYTLILSVTILPIGQFRDASAAEFTPVDVATGAAICTIQFS